MADSNISNNILKRAENRLQICNTLQRHGSLTRSEIAEYCGIRKNSIGSLIDDLETKGFLANNSGRKRLPIELNNSSKTILSLELCAHYFNIASINLNGKIVHRETFPTNAKTRTEYLKAVTDSALKFSKDHKLDILAMGIALPGIVDYSCGNCIEASNLPDFTNIPLQSLFESYFNCSVSVMNSVDASLYSFDRLLNKTREIKNALFIDIVTGVGTSIMIDGKIMSGSNSMAGEIGQIKPKGYKHTIDHLCSMDGMLRDASKITGKKITAMSDFLALLKSDKAISKMFKEKAELIAEPLIFALGFLDPDAIIFSNQPKEFYNQLIAHLDKEIKKRMMHLNAKYLISSENNSLIGVALKSIDCVFSDPEFDQKF
ncbi:MAG: ROK family transcriptional regulator [Lentisphaeraceae bacterium]|nr:ROK family transcriptional regulator [Lentisphaeraceae bacterium]